MTISKIKKRFFTLNPLALFYYFCLTVIIVRATILVSINLDHIPAIYVRGWHIHHFVFGFLCLVLVLDEYGRKKMPRWMAEVLLGVGLGLMFDEFAFWTMGKFDYWSMNNFFAAISLGIGAGILSRVNRQPFHVNFQHKKTKKRTAFIMDYSFRRQVILPWASFACLLFIIFSLN
ncbi:MAG: hypothetical protein KW788_03110 [Candidatus Doudnabacteria bacterium]|nr:hypothetical protein [Candidatus Doudnabacteria bacterium]